MGKTIKAKEFYARVRNKSKYKLVNGLFIVKNEGRGIYRYIGDFHKVGSVMAGFLNKSKKNRSSFVETYGISTNLFNPSKRLQRTSLGVWVKSSIGFRMQPLSAILR